MIKIPKHIVTYLIVFLLVIQALISAIMLFAISSVTTKANWTYHYGLPEYEMLTKLEVLHEYRFSQFLMLLQESEQNTKQDIADNLRNTAAEVEILLHQLNTLPHLPEDKEIINDYVSLRKQIVEIRDKQIVPQILSGNDKDIINLTNRSLYPLLDERREQIQKITERIKVRSKQESHNIFVIARRAYVIAAMVFFLSISVSIWFFLLYRRLEKLHLQTEKQQNQIEALRTTMNTVNDIVLNALNGLQLFRLRASDNKKLSEEDLTKFDMIISNTAHNLKKLGDVEQYETYEAAQGISVVKMPHK